MRNKGYALLESLVAVGIIAVTAWVLFSSIQNSSEGQARLLAQWQQLNADAGDD